MRSLPTTIAVLAVILAFAGVRELLRKKLPSPENGQLIGETYTNSAFGFTLNVPANAPVQDRAALEKGIRKNLPRPRRLQSPFSFKSIEIPDFEIHKLLAISDHPPEKRDMPWISVPWSLTDPTNCSLIITAQNISWDTHHTSAREFLQLWRNAFENPYRRGDVQNNAAAEVSIGGRTFDQETFHANRDGVPVAYQVSVRIENNYALQFLLIAPTDDELERLEKILATAHFN